MIVVTREKTASTVRQEFHQEFPFLKIDFFQNGGGHSKNKIPDNKTFDVFESKSHLEHISISPSMTVAELENYFRTRYHLSVQVYRLSGKAWLETTLTDSWTLQEQNDQGKALSS